MLNSENIKQEIGIQIAFHLDIKLQKVHLKQNMIFLTFSQLLVCPFLTTDGNVDTYATT